MKKAIIILGSSRPQGETRRALDDILKGHPVPIVDLSELTIAHFDYEFRNKEDDFLPLMERILEHDLIILATPVYWYTMSALMKIFVDRFSDLLHFRKDMGRRLRGKHLYVIASFHGSFPKSFEAPFEQTCEYLGMQYLGCSYICSGAHEEFVPKNPDEVARARKVLEIE